jgi:primosomal protein N' (replication factor Y)
MLYAKVVLGLPVEGPFDYFVPENLYKRIKVGVRVEVNFRNKMMVAYVVKLSRQSKIKNIKPITRVIDRNSLLDKNFLILTKQVSDYYCCSWGQAIETALPEAIRKGRPIPEDIRMPKLNNILLKKQTILLHDLDINHRWDIYLKEIKDALAKNLSIIILLPDINSILSAKGVLESKLDCSLAVLYRKRPKELKEWVRIKSGKVNIVLGSRSAIFAPLVNLGLVIIEEEHDTAFKQDQVPHYHPREIAFMRQEIQNTKVILGSATPSLESFYLARKNKIDYIFYPKRNNFPEIKIIDTKYLSYQGKKKVSIFSKFLEDAISLELNLQSKILLFLNRKGFATVARCPNCGMVLKCQRCNINLAYYFYENILKCHYCNFKIDVPRICPQCNSSYIKFSGLGTEKLESELSRLFPQAKIRRLDNSKQIDTSEIDIFVATSSIIKQSNLNFDVIGILAIDNSLNHIDFRASEKTFDLLIGLVGLAKKKLIIQTAIPNHYCFGALVKKDINIFYDAELKQRWQLAFPPYQHMVLVKLRGRKEEKTKETSLSLFKRLKLCNKDKKIRILSVNPTQPAKLRGNFYWQILISSDNAKRVVKFLKIILKDFSHSGIIVTVDVDPL